MPLTGERKLAAILNSINEAVITVDAEHRVTSLNRAAERLVGVLEPAAVGSDCRTVLSANFGAEQRNCPMGDLAGGITPRSDVDGLLRRADGTMVPVSASWAPLEDESGGVHGFVLIFRSFEEIERIAEERRSRFPFTGIVGRTPEVRRLFDLIEMVKDTDSTVLITGESGTGKGVIARAIHDLSPRSAKPFVKVNCAALTETLLESELFGHVRGAFTGAVADKVGRFEAADGGTIFLDEIGEISPALQVKLLHVLQDHEYQKVGSSRTLRTDVRVIAATNRELRSAMKEGRFREDLFYRLNVIPVVVPPLRDRKDDIPLLVEHILKRLRRRGLDRVKAVSPEAMRCLVSYPWPGNIRELENLLERGVVCARGQVLLLEDLSGEVLDHCRGKGAAPPSTPPPSGRLETDAVGPGAPGGECSLPPAPRLPRRSEAEREVLLQALEANRWNRAAAAAALGVERTTLWRRMKKWGIA